MPRRGAPRAALPFAAASGTRSPGTPPLPAGLDRLATAQGGHRSAFSRSPRPCTRSSALRGPPTPGKTRPHTPIGRSRRMSLVQLVEPSPLPDRPDGAQLQVGLQNCEVPEAWVCGLRGPHITVFPQDFSVRSTSPSNLLLLPNLSSWCSNFSISQASASWSWLLGVASKVPPLFLLYLIAERVTGKQETLCAELLQGLRDSSYSALKGPLRQVSDHHYRC